MKMQSRIQGIICIFILKSQFLLYYEIKITDAIFYQRMKFFNFYKKNNVKHFL